MVLKLDVESENAATTVSLVRLQQTKSLGRESETVVAQLSWNRLTSWASIHLSSWAQKMS